MGGAKIELCKATLSFTIQQLKSTDRLAIVIYDTEVLTIVPLTEMNVHGKRMADDAVKKIRERGQTNLSGGLLEGVKILQKKKLQEGTAKTQISSVILLTDGLANCGIKTKEGIIEALIQEFGEEPPCSIHTFGYGSDHDAGLLKAISDQAHGVYYFLENKDSIPQAFGDCIGGLLSVVGQNLMLSVELCHGANSFELMSTQFKVSKNEILGTQVVNIGQIQSEEERDILCSVVIHPCDVCVDSPLIKFTLDYTNVLTSNQESVSTVTKIDRPLEIGFQEGDYEIDKQRNRIITAETLQSAKLFADSNQYKEAKEILNGAITKLMNSISKNDQFVLTLLSDLQESLLGMENRSSYVSSNTSHKMASKSSSHWNQKSNTNTTSYCTSKKAQTTFSYTSSDFGKK